MHSAQISLPQRFPRPNARIPPPRFHTNRLARIPAAAQQQGSTDPFSTMDLYMDRQMRLMNDQMLQMDRDLSSMMAQARQEAETQALQYERVNDNIQIRRSEERGPGSYRFYESISISSGPQYYTVGNQQPLLAGSGVSPLVFVAAVLAGAYATLAAAFARGFDSTIYSSKYRWLLILAWPLLFPFSAAFRDQFMSAIKGVSAPRPGKEEQQNLQQNIYQQQEQKPQS